jgi:glyoxylase-like metal-dependent hydrolase (beta-lactamase superfamily II)
MYTLPKLGIGERAIIVLTPDGTVMWDLLAYMDDETIRALKAPPFNGLKAIVISHPHYYTNHLDWAEEFDCPVYISAEDEEWVSRKDAKGRRRLIKGRTEEIVPGVTAIKVGGHFPGSLVLHWKKMLFLADSLVTQPVSLLTVKAFMSLY